MSYYEGIADGYDELYEQEQLQKIKAIENYASLKGLILDVGAGTCIAAKYFYKQGKQVISIDPSQKLLDQGEGITLIGKAERLPFKDDTFDTIISITALHHCDVKKALQEIKRVAKPGATIAISFLKRSSKLAAFRKAFEEILGKGKEKDIGKDVLFIKGQI